jgi:hypothetical protein
VGNGLLRYAEVWATDNSRKAIFDALMRKEVVRRRHLLFVLCLLLLVRDVRKLPATVTAFTLAHSITLAAGMLGFVPVPVAPVEAAFALSSVFLASELARDDPARSAVTQSYPCWWR